MHGCAPAQTPTTFFRRPFWPISGERRRFRRKSKAWLIQTTLRCSKKLLFSPFARRKAPLQEADALPVFDTREDTDLWRALCALPDKYRLPVHLFYFEDMTTRQIAAALSLSEGSVRVRLTRGRALLRETLESMGIHSL